MKEIRLFISWHFIDVPFFDIIGDMNNSFLFPPHSSVLQAEEPQMLQNCKGQ